jgi:hypothetical protein
MCLSVCAVIPATFQRRLIRCKSYKCPVIAWFGPLERQLKEGLFLGHFVAKHLFVKGHTTTFLGDCSAAEFSATT